MERAPRLPPPLRRSNQYAQCTHTPTHSHTHTHYDTHTRRSARLAFRSGRERAHATGEQSIRRDRRRRPTSGRPGSSRASVSGIDPFHCCARRHARRRPTEWTRLATRHSTGTRRPRRSGVERLVAAGWDGATGRAPIHADPGRPSAHAGRDHAPPGASFIKRLGSGRGVTRAPHPASRGQWPTVRKCGSDRREKFVPVGRPLAFRLFGAAGETAPIFAARVLIRLCDVGARRGRDPRPIDARRGRAVTCSRRGPARPLSTRRRTVKKRAGSATGAHLSARAPRGNWHYRATLSDAPILSSRP